MPTLDDYLRAMVDGTAPPTPEPAQPTLLQQLEASLAAIEESHAKNVQPSAPAGRTDQLRGVGQVGQAEAEDPHPGPVSGLRLVEDLEAPDVQPAGDEAYYVWEHPYHYLTGPAGSGKTYLTRERIKQSAPGSCVIMASTGIAAVNLGDAVTINSQLGYFDTNDLHDRFTNGSLQGRLRRMRQNGITRLVLDEVSMTEADQLTYLVRAIEELNAEASVLMGHDKPMGFTVVGDFLQLPPVKGKFAFESEEWKRFHVETLSGIKRTDDAEFIQALRCARNEDVEGVMRYFGPKMQRWQDPEFDGTTILAKNKEVERLNRLRHDALPGTPQHYTTNRWGKERGEWKNIPLQLSLKPNAQVMILANRYEDKDGTGLRELLYANGDNAHYLGKNLSGNAEVLLTRTGQTVEVKWVTREHYQYLKDPKYVCSNQDCSNPIDDGRVRVCDLCGAGVRKITKELIGEITYLPLRLAYASTVHKTQGLTLDSVQVVIGDPFFTAPGMLYVALSRARDPNKLRIVGTSEQLRSRVKMDPKVKPWR